MTLSPTPRQPLTQMVIEQLRAQINSGEWPVGTRIPTEPDLIALLNVGRNTVREAVRALVHAGVLETRQGSGTFVVAIHEMSGAVARRLKDAELAEAVEVRRAFEVEGARLAATRRTSADMKALDAALYRREDAWRSGMMASFVEADALLHERIVAAAHNKMLGELYACFGETLRAALHRQVDLQSGSYVDHSELVEAIRAQDSDRAARAAGAILEA